MNLLSPLVASTAALTLAAPSRTADTDLLVFDWAGYEIRGVFAAYLAKNGAHPIHAFSSALMTKSFRKLLRGSGWM